MRCMSFIMASIVGLVGGAMSLAQQRAPVAEEVERWAAEERQHLSRLFEISFDHIRRGTPQRLIPDELLGKHPEHTLKVLRAYQEENSRDVRYAGYAHAWRVAINTDMAPEIRQNAVRQLVNACADPDGVVWQQAARWLLDFHQRDFSREARIVLEDLIRKEPGRTEVLLVSGVAGMTELDSWLKKISDKHFNAVLALARLGDENAARHAVSRARTVIAERDKDRGSWTRMYLRKLAYTRHPLALQYIAEYLDRDDGEIIANDYYRPPYKQVAIDLLAKQFPECPVRARQFGRYSEPEFAAVREWVHKRLEENEQ